MQKNCNQWDDAAFDLSSLSLGVGSWQPLRSKGPMEFEISNLRSDDPRSIAQTETYLLDNPDPGVRIRPRTEIDKAIAGGQGVLIFLDGEICGCSLVYKFPTPAPGPVYSEIGTMRITANGFDFQTFLAKLHLFQFMLEGDNKESETAFAVVSSKTASEHNLKNKVLLKNWSPPGDLSLLRSNAGTPFSPEKEVLVSSQEALALALRDLKAWHLAENTFRTPKVEGSIRLKMGWFSPDLLEIEL